MKQTSEEAVKEATNELDLNGWEQNGYRLGYNKSQETHPFSEEDMIDFAIWRTITIIDEPLTPIGELELWKQNRIKTKVMNKEEYIVISKTAIQKRIEELEKQRLLELKDDFYDTLYLGEINSLKQILSQSTPLIPEIEKAYFEGECYGIGTDACIRKDDYISNLKLDI